MNLAALFTGANNLPLSEQWHVTLCRERDLYPCVIALLHLVCLRHDVGRR
jgi:hypothetical protein